MGIHFLLLDTVQIILTSGGAAVFILSYATRDIFLREESPQPDGRFASQYDELMWLANKERGNTSLEERRRFFRLRHDWYEMHSPHLP